MIQLVYLSSARTLFDQEALLRLLARARARNEAQGITGLLLYKDGNFLQVIEGDETAVRALFKRIEADPRHKDLLVLLEEAITTRSFPDWSMGFRDIDDPAVRALPGFSALMSDARARAGFGSDPTGCLALIDLFRSGR